MIEKEEQGPVLREHSFDGIQEYDQKLPNWWLFTFYGAIAFFIIFWVLYYQTNLLKSDTERLNEKMSAIEEAQAKELEALLSEIDDNVLWQMSQNSKITSAGRVSFERHCWGCHAKDLSATMNGNKLTGLPLNDAEWKHGGNPMSVFKVITEGSPDKKAGMQSWRKELTPKQIAEVAAYVMSYHKQPPPEATTPPE